MRGMCAWFKGVMCGLGESAGGAGDEGGGDVGGVAVA